MHLEHTELLRLSRMSSDELRILVDREIQYPEGASDGPH